MTTQTSQTTASTSFSDFIRNGSSIEKDRVFTAVLKDTTEAQRRIIQQASTKTPK